MNIAEQIGRARIIIALLSIVYFWSSPLNGQIVSQDFDGLNDLTEFVEEEGNPDEGQVNNMNLDLSNTGTPIFSLGEEDGNKFLQVNKQGRQMRHFGRSSGIDNAPTLVIAFDFELKSVESVESKKRIAGWFMGNDLYGKTRAPVLEERWGEIGIFADPKQNKFTLSNHREGEDSEASTSYSGKRRISIIANNSGGPISYDDPDGKITEISNEEVHIWVDKEQQELGNEEPYLGANAQAQGINAIKFMVWNNDIDAVYQIDNLVIGTLDAVQLPVTLLDFRAALLDRDVQLNWQTASEKNSSYFEIERSLDGKHFVTLGQVPAAGNSHVLKVYAYADPEVTELMTPALYYRLRMVDIDGTYEYSPVRVVEIANIFREFITVSPNPFNDQLLLQVQPGHGDLLYMELLDQKGAMIFRRQQALPAGNSKIRINSLEGLSSGMYFLKVRTAVSHRFLRLIKL